MVNSDISGQISAYIFRFKHLKIGLLEAGRNVGNTLPVDTIS